MATATSTNVIPLTSETWRPVPGYIGFYEVSDHGRVRSLDRTVTDRLGRICRHHGRILKGRLDQDGYPGVTLYRNGARRYQFVHRLVLATFIGPIPDGMVSRHLNGRPDDNRLNNLAIGTQAENIADAIAHGTHVGARVCCPRGHALEGANLVPSHLCQGRRKCLACNRARAHLYGRDIRIDSPEGRAVADDYHEAILYAAAQPTLFDLDAA